MVKKPASHEAPQEETAEVSRRRRTVLAGAATAVAGLVSGCAPGSVSPISAAANPTPPNAAAPRGRLEGDVVFVTGAARGIGRAICVASAHEGADVVGFDIAGPVSRAVSYPPATPQDFAETGRLVEGQGRRFLAVRGDVRSPAALHAAAGQAVAQFGKLDVLVANAGIMVPAGIMQVSDRGWQDVVDVNLTGVANSMRAVIPHMAARKHGRIIAIASIKGRMGVPLAPQYNAAKWGVIGLVKTAALELGPKGITVNAVSPTGVDTVLLRNSRQYAAMTPNGLPTLPEFAVAFAGKQVHPLGVPWIEPEDVAAIVVFLASPAARYVSGASFDVTAGLGAIYTA
jgi:SDR family mycofactocin-dependent oxidoreductase